ncbi:hypothetical protein X474_05240 [Dethiosulfatarculus sandiegensis]|uniref:Uncharacterized protein n=1 Tax=Dethiosulfatarculus sandiegensis TaxID=1429043 RepID=A0A0D2JHK2_9BACT|nr:hypothetical protein X474_05240 [Dethiosulfatarculus sandiegensis]
MRACFSLKRRADMKFLLYLPGILKGAAFSEFKPDPK